MGKFCSQSCYHKSMENKVERTCLACSEPFMVFPSQLEAGGKYCSRSCWNSRTTRPIADRFWEKVNKTDGCWLWTGTHNGVGYGKIGGEDVKQIYAHRLSWTLHHGPIPDGMQVLHRCDTPACVRPDHLFLGSQLVNMRDMHSKRRGMDGGGHYLAKLKESDIPEIIRLKRDGIRVCDISLRYAVSRTTIDAVLAGKTWKHVPRS